MVLEIARDVLGYEDAEHAELNPGATRLFITPLSCSLKGQTMPVSLVPGSLAARAYGQETATERYYCDFGLNPDYASELEAGGLQLTGTGPEGEPRVVEWQGPGSSSVPSSSLKPRARSQTRTPLSWLSSRQRPGPSCDPLPPTPACGPRTSARARP